MKSAFKSGAATVAAALSVTLAPAASAHDIEGEAKAWFEGTYAADYISGATDFYDHYSEKVLFVTPEEAKMFDKADLIPFLQEEYIDAWNRNGLSQIELLHMEATVLGPNTVNIAGSWKLYNEAGGTVAHCERPVWNYILNRESGTWKVIGEVEASC